MAWSIEAKIALVSLLLSCVPASLYLWKVYKKRRLRAQQEGSISLSLNVTEIFLIS
jgi:hypothetical protein